MTLSVNNLNTAKWANVDLSAAKQISDHILNVNSSRATISAVSNYTPKAMQGVDFYSASTSIDTQRQISIANAGLNVSSVNNSQLNSLAALSSYNTFKAVEGKLHIGLTETKSEIQTPAFGSLSSTEVYKTAKDTKGSNSNPFTNNNNEQNPDDNKVTNEKSLNILG